LSKIVEGMEASTNRLRECFWNFGGYHDWLMKRMPREGPL
jgi:hypothetical protein